MIAIDRRRVTQTTQSGLGLAILVLLVISLFWILWYIPVSHAQEQIQVTTSEVITDFPNTITFSLSAESSAAPISKVQLLYGATRSEALTIIDVDTASGERVDAEYELDTQVYYLLPGTEISYRWVLEDAEGNVIETPLEELVYVDERFDWRERTERGVTVYWYAGDDAFGDSLIGVATETLDRLQEEIGSTVQDPVNIYIYANTTDMRSALQQNQVEWVGGLAVPSLGIILGAVAPGDIAEAERLIPHELSHQVLHQATENPYGGVPLWVDEGLAVYNQYVVEPQFGILLAEAAHTGQLIPLEALESSFPADPQKALLSYAQSYSVVAYILDTYGPEKMQALVTAFRDAVPPDEAIQTALGLSIDELDRAWRETLPPAVMERGPENNAPIAAPPDRFAGDPVLPPQEDVVPESQAAADDQAEFVATPAPAAESTSAMADDIVSAGVALAVVAMLVLLVLAGVATFVIWRIAFGNKNT